MTQATRTALPTDIRGPRYSGTSWQGTPLKPVQPIRRTYAPGASVLAGGPAPQTASVQDADSSSDFVLPVMPKALRETRHVPADAASIPQVWEGEVLELEKDLVRARLRDKSGALGDHLGDIYWDEISPQDRDLVQPGAVFYLTIYVLRRPGGTRINAQELRFRRQPTWTAQQVDQVHILAAKLRARAAMKPIAE